MKIFTLHRLVLFFGTLLFSVTAISQDCAPQIIWEQSYGFATQIGGDFNHPVSIHELPNSDIVSAGGVNNDYWITCTDAQGNVKWNQSYGGTLNENLIQMIPTFDGGFMLVGSFDSNDGSGGGGFGARDYWLVKLNNTGNFLWSKRYGGGENDTPFGAVQTPDGGIVIVGNSLSPNEDLMLTQNFGDSNSWVLKVDASGNEQFSVKLGVTQFHELFDVAYSPNDDSYVVAGQLVDTEVGNRIVLTKLNSNGNLIWNQIIEPENNNGLTPFSITNTSDNGFILSGKIGNNALALKTNGAGEEQWRTAFGGSGNERAEEIIQTSDGGYAIAGISSSTDGDMSGNNGDWDAFLAQLDPEGALHAIQNFGGSAVDYGESIALTADGNILMGCLGRSTNGDISNNDGQSQTWIVKIDPCINDQVDNSTCEPTITWDQSYDFTTPGGLDFIGTRARAIHELPNGEIVFAGGANNIWITKTDAVGNIIWTKSYGGSSAEFLIDMQPTNDGGFAAISASLSSDGDVGANLNQRDYWLLKLDGNGEIEWSQTYGGYGNDVPKDMSITPDNDIIIVGNSDSQDQFLNITANHGNSESWVLKVDDQGNQVWSIRIGFNIDHLSEAIIQAPNSTDYVIAGYYENEADIDPIFGPHNMVLTKITSNGDLIWYNTVLANSSASLLPEDIAVTLDGGYVITGMLNPSDVLVIKVTSEGAEEWRTNFGGPFGDGGRKVMQLPSNEYAVIGYTGSTGGSSGTTGSWDALFAKLASNGDVISMHNFGGDGTEEATCFTRTADGNFLIGGKGASINIFGPNGDVTANDGSSDTWVFKLDACSDAIDCSQVSTEIQTSQNFLCGNDEVTLNAGNGFITYNWLDGVTGQVRNVNTAGTYEVEVVDVNGCTDTATIEIQQFIAPSVFILNQPEYCGGDFAILGAQNGFENYQWSNGATTSSTTANVPGDYTVMVTDANGCTGSTTTTIVQNPQPVVNLSTNNNDFCAGSSLQISAGIHDSYSWSNGSIAPMIEISTAGTYQVTVTSSSGCEASDEITISELPLPSVSFAETEVDLCMNDTIGLQTQESFAIYQWSNGNNSEINNVTAQGTYTVTVTDLNNCKNTADIIVNELPLPFLDLSNNVNSFCENDSILITANSNANEYIWSNGNATPSTTISAQGNYSVTVTDTNDCANSEEIFIQENALPFVEFTNPATQFCYGQILLLSVTPEFENYQWTGFPNIGNNISVTESGTYGVTVTDENGCSNSIERTVTEVTEIIADAGMNQVIDCNNSSVTLGGPNSTIDPDLIYLWTGPNGAEIGSEAQIEVFEPGLYTLKIGVSPNFCNEFSNVTVTENLNTPTATISGATQLDCDNDLLVLDGSNPNNPNNITYQWTNSAGDLLGENFTLDILSAGAYFLSVTNPDSGCSDTTSVVITESSDLPVAMIETTGQFDCQNQTVFLDIEGSSTGINFSYNWYFEDLNSSVISTEQNFEITTEGTYFLQVINSSNNCSATSQVTLEANQTLPVVIAELNDNGELTCEVDIIFATTENSDSNLDFEWYDEQNQLIGSDNFIQLFDVGSYQLVGTDVNGCANSFEFQVTQNDTALEAVATASGYYICDGSSVTLSSEGSSVGSTIQYSWILPNGEAMPDQQPSIEVTQTGTFTLVVTDLQTGCDASTLVEVNPSPDTTNSFFEIPDELNCYNETVFLDGSNSTHQGIYSIVWTDADGNELGTDPMQPVTEPGIYYLTSTNNETACTGSTGQLVTANFDTPEVMIEAPEMLTCTNESVTLDASNSSQGSEFEYQWTDANGVLSETGNILTVENGGTYTLQITNTTNGCTNTFSTDVIQEAGLPEVMIESPEMLTCTIEEVTLDASNSSQGSEFEYQWSDANSVLPETGNSLSVTDAGNYTLEITNNLTGCSNTFSVDVIKEAEVPQVFIELPETISCLNEEVVLDGSNSSQGTEFEYQWQLANVVLPESGNMLTVAEPGLYSLLVTNTNTGCDDAFIVEVIESIDLPEVMIESPEMLTCTNEEVTLDASNSSQGSEFEYQWQDTNGVLSETGNTLTVENGGMYTLQITNTTTGCSDTFTTEVIQEAGLPEVIIESPEMLTCTNEEVTLDASNSSQGTEFDYQWTSANGVLPETGNSLSVTAAGNYMLEITNSLTGCSNTFSVDVSGDNTLPQVIIESPAMLTCTIDEITLDASNSSQGSNFNYQWLDADGNALGTSSIYTATNAGTYQLQITNTENGCSETASVEVMQDADLPTVLVEASGQLTCTNTSVILDAANSSQGSNFEYQWTNSNGVIPETGNSLAVDSAGIYQLQITNTNSNCSEDILIEVFENMEPPEVFVEGPLPILTCTWLEVTLTASSNPGSNYSYTWLDPDGVLLPDTTASIQGTIPGSYTIQVINEVNGCAENFFASAVQDTVAPIAMAGMDVEIPCGEDLSIQLNGAGSSSGPLFEYEWTSDNNNSVSDPTAINPTVSVADVYTLQVTNWSTGCSTTDEVVLTNSDGITSINFENNEPDCFGESNGMISITDVVGGTAPYLFSINEGPFSEDMTFENLEGGTYIVDIQDANNCTWTQSIDVFLPPEYEVSLEPTVNMIAGVEVILNPEINIPDGEIESILWTPTEGLSCSNCLSPTADPNETTNYTLMITTINGCQFTATTTIEVDENEIKVWELISPYNVDGKNDDWTIQNIENFPDNTVIVFNRWGDVVYEAAPYSNARPWKGTNKNGKLLPTGSYYFLIKYDLAETKILKGRVVIVE